MKGANGQLPKLRPDVRLYLFHGADEAGAADLARRLAATVADAERVDLDGATLKKEPGRLADEALSPSLFGDARLIRASVTEDSLEAVSLLLDADRTGSPVIATAAGLKKSSKLVALVSGHARGLVVACYAPSAEEAEKIATTMLAQSGLRPGRGVAGRIAEASGGDRAVMSREIEKLALFLDAAPERPQDVAPGDLDAIGADLGETELTEAVEALLDGKPGVLGARLTRLDEGGASPVPWLRALQRKLTTIGDMRSAVDRGESPDEVLKRNNIRWPRAERAGVELRRWNGVMIAEALRRIRDAEAAAMSSGTAGAVAAEHAAVALARRVAR